MAEAPCTHSPASSHAVTGSGGSASNTTAPLAARLTRAARHARPTVTTDTPSSAATHRAQAVALGERRPGASAQPRSTARSRSAMASGLRAGMQRSSGCTHPRLRWPAVKAGRTRAAAGFGSRSRYCAGARITVNRPAEAGPRAEIIS
jgi:hypothetical protein